MRDVLEAKIALEEELAPKMEAFLRGYIVALNDAGIMSSFAQASWRAKLQALLVNHYSRTVMVMTGRKPSRVTPIEVAALDQDHAVWLLHQAQIQGELILASVAREFQRQLAVQYSNVQVKSLDSFIELKAGLGSRLTAKAKEILAKMKAKVSGIVNGQTNSVAEDARLRAAQAEAGKRRLWKRWSTMQDSKVRPHHDEAEGQERLVEVPFTVNNEQLMFPGDNGLGAKLNNLINCRCSAVYFTHDAQGNRQDLGQTPRLTPVKPNSSVGSIDHPSLITRSVALQNGAIERIFLTDMLEARLTIRDGVIRVTRGGQRLAIGRFTHGRQTGAQVLDLRFTAGAENIGIAELVQRSLAQTNRR